MTRAVIVILMAPPIEVSPNWHGPWRRRARAVAEFREQAGWATRAAVNANEGGLAHFLGNTNVTRLDADIAWQRGRNQSDPTNAPILLKAAIDGIADVLWNSRDDHVYLGAVKQTRGDGVTMITLSEGADGR